jgi:hypothetical protein
MAGGPATLSNLATTVAEVYEKPFMSLKDTGKNSFLKRLPTKKAVKATVDWKVRDAEYSPVWSASESDQSAFITSTVWASDGVGSATAFLAPNNHPLLNASVTIRANYAALEVTKFAELVGEGPGAHVNILKDEMEQLTIDFWRSLNIDALSTATTAGNSGKDIDGLGVMFNATSYAGIAVASYPESIPLRDTTTTTLTIAGLQTMFNGLEGGTDVLGTDTIREADIKEIWTSPAQWTAYGNLLTGFRRYAPDDTLDGGIGPALNFNNVPVLMIQRFPTGYLVMYGGGMEYRVLQALTGSDKSQNKVDATAMQYGHFSNICFKQRTQSGIFTSLV